eukprot:Awhi_evm1s11311
MRAVSSAFRVALLVLLVLMLVPVLGVAVRVKLPGPVSHVLVMAMEYALEVVSMEMVDATVMKDGKEISARNSN